MNSTATAGASHIPFQRRRSFLPTLLVAIALFFGSIFLDVILGPSDVHVTPQQFIQVLQHRLLHTSLEGDNAALDADSIVWDFRLPRALVAALVGALLGYAGVALQGLLMNPLADPYTVGVSSGCAVGAALAEVLGFSALWMGLGTFAFAFAAGIGALLLVYSLARVGGRVSVQTFLLAGVIVGSLLWSLIPLFMTLANRSGDLSRIMFYLIGNIQSADWTRVWLLIPFLLITVLGLLFCSRDLNLMTLGEETAAHLGVETEGVKRRVLLIASCATAAAVSTAGIIAFVGLVVPHLARRFVGPDHRALLPLAGLFGATLLILSDTIVRVYLNDMAVGVVTSIIGAPVFCYLLRRRRATAW
jgi:iron complex transport system permease protein